MESRNIPKAVIRRLPRYYRYLSSLREDGIKRISSGELSKLMRITASQMRQDLNYFGGFGHQGYGYNVDELYQHIALILGTETEFKAIVIGAGNIGRSIAKYKNFIKRGFVIKEIFDNDPNLIGTKIDDFIVRDINELECYLRENETDIAMLAVPREVTRDMAEKVVSLGIKGIWNFSPMGVLVSDENVVIENVHLSDSLMVLGYNLRNHNIK